jgi:hypothetical protein
MIRKYKLLILTVIILSYALMHVATRKDICDTDCEKVYSVHQALKLGRNYVYNVTRCSFYPSSDTLCVLVDLTSGAGVDWNALADTTCTYASQYGLSNQKVFIIGGTNGFANDTVARKQCP